MAPRDSSSYRWIVLLVTSIASFMTPFDGSVVTLALPSIASSFQASFTYIIWIPIAYLLVLASLQTTMGRLADMRGRKRIFIIGLGLFTSGSFLAAFSGNVSYLVVSRIIQGVGGATMNAVASALVVDVFPDAERGRALGMNVMAVYLGGTVGPIVGGFLVQAFGWRSIFYVNIPIGVWAVLLTAFYLRKDELATSWKNFDLPGACALTSFLATLLLILSDASRPSEQMVTLSAACTASFVGFVFLERRTVITPLLDLRLFTRNRLFAAGNATALMNYVTTSSAILIVSLYLQRVLRYSPVQAGMILLAQPIAMTIVSPIAGALSDRTSARVLSSIGMFARSVGFLFLSFLGTGSHDQDILVPLILIGLGHGLFSSPNTNSVMSSVPSEMLGLASGVLGTVRSAAQSVGVAVLATVVAANMPPGSFAELSNGMIVPTRLAEFFVLGMNKAFLFATALSVVGVFTSLVRGRQERFGNQSNYDARQHKQ